MREGWKEGEIGSKGTIQEHFIIQWCDGLNQPNLKRVHPAPVTVSSAHINPDHVPADKHPRESDSHCIPVSVGFSQSGAIKSLKPLFLL